MQAGEYWLTLALLSGLAAAAFWFIWNRWRRARLIDDVPTAKIRSAAQGYTELHGRAVFAEGFTTASPLTGTSCLWYRFKIERRGRDGRGRRTWRMLHTGSSDTPFLLDDDTGLCLIDPRGAEVSCAHKRIWYGNQEWPVPPTRAQPAGSWLTRQSDHRRYRYTEELLHPGNLYALGLFQTVNGAQRTVDIRVRELLHTWKSDQPALTRRFDRNGDGRIDVEEWEQAREAALQQVLQRQLSRTAAAPLHTLGAPRNKRHPFLLTDRSPAQLAQRYRAQAAASLAVFVASSLSVLWLLGQRA